MQISPQTERFLHQRLPIDDDERILGVYRHHWFVYVMSWATGVIIALLVMAVAVALTLVGDGTVFAEHRVQVIAGAAIFALLIVAGSFVPVYLRAQEQLVLTEESLLQVLQPSLFASKIDQMSLQHIADVSVRQDFLGSIFGYGHITIETPGEQDNFVFLIIARPDKVAREVTAAHEDYVAALEGGYMPSGLAQRHGNRQAAEQQIDPEQYRQFLEYQQMVARQRQEQQQAPNNSGNDQSNGRPTFGG